MLTEPTMEKLKGLRLEVLAASWAEQQKNPEVQKLSFDERLGMLVDAECLHRENKRLGRLLKDAKLRISNACVEDIDYPPRRELEKATIRQLASCRWVEEHQTIAITGMTGTWEDVRCVRARAAGVSQGFPRHLQARHPPQRRAHARARRRKLHGPARPLRPG